MFKIQQTLTSRLIVTCLNASKMRYIIDKDGDFRIDPPHKSFILIISIRSSTELRLLTIYPNPIPPRKFAEALMACNTFHQKSTYGRAYLSKMSNNDYYAVYELNLNFENGMLSQHFFLNELWPTYNAHGMEFITNLNKFCEI